MSPESVNQLLHDLQTHQIELEMQNEELRNIQVKLQESNDRYSDLYDNAPVSYFTLNTTGFILEANLTATAMLSIHRHHLLKQPFNTLIHHDDQDIFYLCFRRVCQALQKQTCELRLSLQNKTDLWVHIAFRPILNQQSQLQKVYLSINDISEQKRTKDTLRHNKALKTLNILLEISLEDQLLETILESALKHVLTVPLVNFLNQGVIFLAEDKSKILRLAASQEQSNQLKQHCSQVPYARCICGRVAQDKKPIYIASEQIMQTNCPYNQTHGHYCQPLLHSGKMLGVLNLYLREGHKCDLFEKQFISNVANTIAGIIVHKQARQALERAHQANARFLAATSHDLRQPLQSLSLLLGILEKQAKTKLTREISTDMLSIVHSMNDTINTLLHLSRLNAGIITPERCPFPVAALLHRLKSEFAVEANAKGLILHIVPCSKMINSDPVMLERIINNFLSNAIKYTHQGKILVGCRRCHHNMLRIEIWDTGIGIPKQQFEQIFEAFYQLNNPARENIKGVGLGLSIVEQLAKSLDHQLILRSVLKHGSVFGIEIPLIMQDELTSQKSLEESCTQTLTGITTLFIEDNEIVLNAQTQLLQALSCHVYSAMNAEVAIAQLKKNEIQPDIIICDYLLSAEQNGLELIQTLWQIAGKKLPALLLTADTSPQVVFDAQKMGVIFRQKPILASELSTLILQILKKNILSKAPHEP